MLNRKLLLVALCALAVIPSALIATPPGAGDPAPNFTLPDTAYVNHSLSDYRGKVVQLFFWQST